MNADLARIIAVLERTPHVLRALLSGHDDSLVNSDYGPSTWSAREVVAHMIYAEREDWLPRARFIMEHGETRPFVPFDRAGHAPILRAHALLQLLNLFERERADGLRTLDGMRLSEADLHRRGTHPAFGPVTLGQLLSTWAVHDLNHLAQVCKAVSYQFKTAVGPWEQYLSILSPPNPR